MGASLNALGMAAGSVTMVAPSSLPTSWPRSGLAAGAVVAGAAAGACVGRGADVVHAARTEMTPAPKPVVSSVRRVIVVPRARGCFENIPILLLKCPHSCRAELRRPVVEVHG